MGTDEIEAPALCPKCRPQGATQAPVAAPQPEAARQAEPTETKTERKEQTPVTDVTTSARQLQEVFPHQEDGVEVKLIGRVKWFSRRKGYGFITKADGKDLFFHRSEMADGERNLPNEDEKVEFQIRQTEKGPEAFNVSILPAE
jgi:CspA family cold shock protein